MGFGNAILHICKDALQQGWFEEHLHTAHTLRESYWTKTCAAGQEGKQGPFGGTNSCKIP